jgi:hypothetical protein
MAASGLVRYLSGRTNLLAICQESRTQSAKGPSVKEQREATYEKMNEKLYRSHYIPT